MNIKKTVLVLSCQGGGGHMSAAYAIKEYLEQAYTVIIIDAVGESLAYLDPLYKISRKYTGQDVYNFLLKHNQKALINATFPYGLWLIKRNRKKLIQGIVNIFSQYKPDVVISVIPLINDVIQHVCLLLDIPFILVPTDLDVRTFISGVVPARKSTICVGFNCKEVQEFLDAACQKAHMYMCTGFPIRPSFFVPKDKVVIKKSLNISDGIPVVILVMGATGSPAIIDYVMALRSVPFRMHLIVCIGRNNHLKTFFSSYTMSDSMCSLTVFDNTHDIADAMAIADVGITKPGSVTFSELLYMNVPILIDHTSPALIWERLNVELVEQYGLGAVIKTLTMVPVLLQQFLEDKKVYAATKEHVAAIPKKNFGQELLSVVQRWQSSVIDRK